MRHSLLVIALIASLPAIGLASVVSAQGHGHHGHQAAPGHGAAGSAGPTTPYAGFDSRDIKALSPQQIDDLNNGRGMGLALAAELNDYPGPLHVLELTEQLSLSPEQRQAMTTMIAGMKAETIAIGQRIVQAERALDRLFRDSAVDEAKLTAATAEIGRLSGDLRRAHLAYHLGTRAVLSPEQVARYGVLRGYRAGN